MALRPRSAPCDGRRQATLMQGTIEVIVVWDWYKAVGWYVPVLAGLDPEGDAKHVLEKSLADLTSQWPDLSLTSRVVEGNPSPNSRRRIQECDVARRRFPRTR